MPFESNRLLAMERFEIAKLGISFEPSQRLRDGVHCCLAVPLGFLQVREVLPLNTFVRWIVLCHGANYPH